LKYKLSVPQVPSKPPSTVLYNSDFVSFNMSTKAHSDPTFRSYTAEQAKLYASQRFAYSQALYDVVLGHHTSTGGKLDLLLDCGCGPGLATRDLALSFNKTIGVDPGAAMIAAAQEIGGKTMSWDEIRYVVAAAEHISGIERLQPESVDLLTAAMAVSMGSEPW
jgi:ubiquinone/menaquinone biosynthesis C-methylase UbiE